MNDLSKTVDLALLNVCEFEAECSIESTLAFMVTISDILEVDNKVHATPVPTIPAKYLDLAELFPEDTTNTLPDDGAQDLSLEIIEAPLVKLLYNPSQVELEVLRGNISDNFAKRFIQPSTPSAGAHFLYSTKRDENLRLFVDFWGPI